MVRRRAVLDERRFGIAAPWTQLAATPASSLNPVGRRSGGTLISTRTFGLGKSLALPRWFKEEIIRLTDEGRVLMRFNELREALQRRLSGEFKHVADAELRAALSLLVGPGVVWEPAFASWVLLPPERINAYTQTVIRTLQGDEHPRGCLTEEQVLKGDLAYESSMPRLAGEAERFVLLAMHPTLVERSVPSPSVRKTIAQRFNAGFPGREGNKSRQGRKNCAGFVFLSLLFPAR